MSKAILKMNKRVFHRAIGGYSICRSGSGVGLPIISRPNKIHANITFHLKLTINFNKMLCVSKGPLICVLVS